MKLTTALAAAVLAAALTSGCGGSGGPSAARANPAPAATAAGSSAAFFPNGPRSHAIVWALGDAAPGPGAKAVAGLISRARVDALLYLGDVYPMGTGTAFSNSYAPILGRFARRTAPTPGNHDWPVRGQGYNPYWARVHGRTPPPWYSFSAGGWRILALNSETAAQADELRWLRQATGRAGDCRLAFLHRPRFSAGPHGDNTDIDPIWQALRGHARVLVAGHDHDMQRFSPYQGIVELVSGAGGHSHYPIDRGDQRPAFANDRDYGALRIDLRPGRAQLEFIAASGRRLDSTSVSCRRSG